MQKIEEDYYKKPGPVLRGRVWECRQYDMAMLEGEAGKERGRAGMTGEETETA